MLFLVLTSRQFVILEETGELLERAEENLRRAQLASESSVGLAEQVKDMLALLLKKHAETRGILNCKKEEVLKVLAQISVLFGRLIYGGCGNHYGIDFEIYRAESEIKISQRDNLGRCKPYTITEFSVLDDCFYHLCNQIVWRIPNMVTQISVWQSSQDKKLRA